jgi:hypothetical protein
MTLPDNRLYNYTDDNSYLASSNRLVCTGVSGTDLLIPTRAILLSVPATVTGILIGPGESSFTTLELAAGVQHPFAFKRITAVSNSASIQGFA